MYIYFSEQSAIPLFFLKMKKSTNETVFCKNYGSRSKKSEKVRLSLTYNALNGKPRKW